MQTCGVLVYQRSCQDIRFRDPGHLVLGAARPEPETGDDVIYTKYQTKQFHNPNDNDTVLRVDCIQQLLPVTRRPALRDPCHGGPACCKMPPPLRTRIKRKTRNTRTPLPRRSALMPPTFLVLLTTSKMFRTQSTETTRRSNQNQPRR
mmetsp:Transcript_20895/g.34794  ORF Transcript_20895/g.34794 Transcript_20895/m.34794 type:complete len:148 (-) Transcript_20895:81-524(-)